MQYSDVYRQGALHASADVCGCDYRVFVFLWSISSITETYMQVNARKTFSEKEDGFYAQKVAAGEQLQLL